MEKVENGLFISVDYKGTLENGEVFDSSEGRQPLEIKMGAGQLITGFERELKGMGLDDEKVFTLSPEEAYGQRDDNLTRDFPKADIPQGMNPEVGMTLGLTTEDGHQIPATVSFVDDEKVTLDMNHPLAGETLTFEIKVVGISATPTQAPMGCGGGCDCSSGSCE